MAHPIFGEAELAALPTSVSEAALVAEATLSEWPSRFVAVRAYCEERGFNTFLMSERDWMSCSWEEGTIVVAL